MSSFGYFNDDGDFVVEKYDTDKDAVVSVIYRLNETGGIKPMKSNSVNIQQQDK